MKHLTYDDRLEIQRLLKDGLNFTRIAGEIGRDRATVSREVKARRLPVPHGKGNICRHRDECGLPENCRVPGCMHPYRCRSLCSLCRTGCDRFEEEACPLLEMPPYVCNGCMKKKCRLRHQSYDAKAAQAAYEATLRESRRGVSLSEGDMHFLDSRIAPLIRRGLSVQTVCDAHAGSMPVCSKTLYNYINMGLLGMSNLDLRRKVRRPLRRKSGPALKVDRKCHEGRTYEDFLKFMEENPGLPVCQMDTVEGKKGGKAALTLHFTSCNLQLAYLRDRNTSDSVTEVSAGLRSLLGGDFAALFPVILTDRGTEFSNPQAIEWGLPGGVRDCRVFYCDPQQTNQKSSCERNHELIRYVIPKGKSLDGYTQEDMGLLMNHANSYPRARFNGLSPAELFAGIYGEDMLKKIGITLIPIETLCLKPGLLFKQARLQA